MLRIIMHYSLPRINIFIFAQKLKLQMNFMKYLLFTSSGDSHRMSNTICITVKKAQNVRKNL